MKNLLSRTTDPPDVPPGGAEARSPAKGADASGNTAAETDEALAARLADGDLLALGNLFRRHEKNVFGLCFRMTASRAAAEDLVQETFIRVLRYRHSFRGESRFSTWLYRIARNVTLDYLKREKRQPQGPDRTPGAEAHRSSSPEYTGASDAHQHFYRSEDTRGDYELLRMAMNRLPEDKKDVLVLSRYHELSYREIAAICDCTVSAVKVRVFRALKLLRETYLELENDK